MPGTDEATRKRIACTCPSLSERPFCNVSITDAVAGLSSRTNRLGSAAATWTRALLTASIVSIVRDRSASRAERSASPSIARLDPMGSEAIRLSPLGAALGRPCPASAMRA